MGPEYRPVADAIDGAVDLVPRPSDALDRDYPGAEALSPDAEVFAATL
jgi:hypothetical protein